MVDGICTVNEPGDPIAWPQNSQWMSGVLQGIENNISLEDLEKKAKIVRERIGQ